MVDTIQGPAPRGGPGRRVEPGGQVYDVPPPEVRDIMPPEFTGITRWTRRGAPHPGFTPYPAVPITRQLQISSSYLYNKLPLPYGPAGETKQIPGLISLVFPTTRYVFVVASFANGEIESIGDFEINGTPLADCTYVRNPPALPYFSTGRFDKLPYKILTDAPGLAAENFDEAYPGIADLVIVIWKQDPNTPSSLQITANVGNRLIYDYRTATTQASANPALVMYDILTLEEIGMNVNPDRVNTIPASGFVYYADHCDDIMSDGSRRYEFDGALTSDPNMQQTEAGRHAFLEIDSNGKTYDLFGWDSPAVPAIAATVRLGDWETRARWREIPENKRPNFVTVHYTDGSSNTAATYPAEAPNVSADNIQHMAFSASGTRKQTHAVRIGEKIVNLAAENYEWKGRISAKVLQGVRRGNFLLINTHDGEIDTIVRVFDIGEPVRGYRDCILIKYAPNTDSTSTAVDESMPGPEQILPPPVPSVYSQEFVYAGPWTQNTLLGDPNDLTSWPATDVATAYNAIEERTEITLPAGELLGYIEHTFARPAVETESLLLTVSLRFGARNSARGFVQLVTDSPEVLSWSRQVTPPEDRYIPATWSILLSSLTSDTAPYRLRIRLDSPLPVTPGSEPVLWAKATWMVPSGSQLAQETAYRVIGRHTWELPPDPDGLILGQRAALQAESGYRTVDDLVTEDTDYDYPFLYRDQPVHVAGSAIQEDTVTPGVVASVMSPFLLVLQSVGVLVADFPPPTQAWSMAVPPAPELQIIEHRYTFSNLNEESVAGRDLNGWVLQDVTIDTNYDTAPDGSLTADRATADTAFPAGLQNNNGWPTVIVSKIMRTFWHKKTGTNDYIIAEESDVSSYLYYLRIRPYYRYCPIGSGPYPGPNLFFENSGDEAIIWSSGYQPTSSSVDQFMLRIEWEQTESPWLISHLKFQYRLASGFTKTVYDWIDWGPEISYSDGFVTIGNSTDAAIPWFPVTDPSVPAAPTPPFPADAVFSDWRLVAVGVNGVITEVSDPADVTIDIKPLDSSNLRSSDRDLISSEPYALMGLNAAESQQIHYSQYSFLHTNGDWADPEVKDGDLTLNDDLIVNGNTTVGSLKYGPYYVDVRRSALEITNNPSQSPELDVLHGALFLRWFRPSLVNSAHSIVDLPDGWKEGTDITPFVRWIAEDDGTGTEGVVWTLLYEWRNAGSVWSTDTSISATESQVFVAKKDYTTQLPTISGVGMTRQSAFIFTIRRQANNINDDYAGRAGLLWIDFRSQVEERGDLV